MGPEDAEADNHADTRDIEKDLPDQVLNKTRTQFSEAFKLYLPSMSIRVFAKTVAKMLTMPRMIVER